MALITETNAQYYSGQQKFIGDGANEPAKVMQKLDDSLGKA